MKAVLFDVDDTLYDQVIPFQKAYEELFKGSFELSIEELYNEVVIIVMKCLKLLSVEKCRWRPCIFIVYKKPLRVLV